MAYKTFLSKRYNLSFNNIAIVSAWGKDTIKTLVQICQRYEVPYFVVHDWDLLDDDIVIEDKGKSSIYPTLDATQKAQFTKNFTILSVAKTENVHQNKRNLEAVLNIEVKGTTEVFEKLNNKTFETIIEEFPKFTSENFLAFIAK